MLATATAPVSGDVRVLRVLRCSQEMLRLARLGTTRLFLLLIRSSRRLLLSFLRRTEQLAVLVGSRYRPLVLPVPPGLPGVSR